MLWRCRWAVICGSGGRLSRKQECARASSGDTPELQARAAACAGNGVKDKMSGVIVSAGLGAGVAGHAVSIVPSGTTGSG